MYQAAKLLCKRRGRQRPKLKVTAEGGSANLDLAGYYMLSRLEENR
jgi:hypothetical protein